MDGVFKILLVKALLVLCFNPSLENIFPFQNNITQVTEVPVMDMRFYLMSRSDVKSETIKSIRDNVDYLNKEFEGIIKFEVEHFFIDKGHALLPDLHKEYFGVEKLTIDSLVENIEHKGSINVFVFDSYVVEEVNAELMGFTPIFRASHKDYINASPSFDRIFLSYNALAKQTTLVHEMGHFLGLDHPWEMSEINRKLMGLESEEQVKRNHMAYGLHVDGFTHEQLERMQHFALEFRSYLIDRKEYFVNNNLVSMVEY